MPQTSLVTVSSRSLTDLSSVKRRINISDTDTSSDEFLQELINQASIMFERATGRRFSSSTYIERYDGYNERYVTLRNYPVIKLHEIRHGSDTAFNVRYSGAAIVARVETYTDTEGANGGLRLYSITAAGTETTTDLTFALYPTFSTMKTAIDLVSGWTCTLGTSDGLTKWIVPRSGSDAKNYSVEFVYPGTSVTDVRIDYTSGTASWGLTDDKRYYITGDDDFQGSPLGYRNLMVNYTAGYATIPGDIQKLINDIVALSYASSLVNPALKSEKLGDWSYTLADVVGGISSSFAAFANEIGYYKDLTVGKLGR